MRPTFVVYQKNKDQGHEKLKNYILFLFLLYKNLFFDNFIMIVEKKSCHNTFLNKKFCFLNQLDIN